VQVLVWCLAVGIDPPGESIKIVGFESRWRLAVRRGASGGVCGPVSPKVCGA